MATWNVELDRLPAATAALGDLLAGPLPVGTPAVCGRQLWEEALATPDDRRLYWRRLRAISQLEDAADRLELDRAARGMQPGFTGDATVRVLLTGFDPFHLDTHIGQCNPSGQLALMLDGSCHEIGNGKVAEIRSCIFPVRFADFDAGLVEAVLEPLIDSLDMVLTVSMGRSDFDLERFPGLRRSVTTLDNENREGGGSMTEPVVPPGLRGPEFVEFSLPVRALQSVEGGFRVNDNRRVTTLQRGEFEADSLQALSGQTAVFGSGGGYLSNEISYRVLALLDRHGVDMPAGHIHTPSIPGHDAGLVEQVMDQGAQLVRAAVEGLVV